jgi:alanine racemase
MVDAGPAPAFETGDEAVAVGSQGNEGISPDTVALECSTIGYEIMCSISSRIDRYYILGGRVIHHEPFHPF